MRMCVCFFSPSCTPSRCAKIYLTLTIEKIHSIASANSIKLTCKPNTNTCGYYIYKSLISGNSSTCHTILSMVLSFHLFSVGPIPDPEYGCNRNEIRRVRNIKSRWFKNHINFSARILSFLSGRIHLKGTHVLDYGYDIKWMDFGMQRKPHHLDWIRYAVASICGPGCFNRDHLFQSEFIFIVRPESNRFLSMGFHCDWICWGPAQCVPVWHSLFSRTTTDLFRVRQNSHATLASQTIEFKDSCRHQSVKTLFPPREKKDFFMEKNKTLQKTVWTRTFVGRCWIHISCENISHAIYINHKKLNPTYQTTICVSLIF